MKGIILAGGSGSRLLPATAAFSKQLIPIYDKPMIYYPLSVLMGAGIREILIITSQRDKKLFIDLLGNGSKFGIKLTYKIQKSPKGIAEAFIIGKKFIGKHSVALILGDNIFYGDKLYNKLIAEKNNHGATIFTYPVKDPSRFGIVKIGKNRKVISLEEKPKKPNSNLAVTGLYFYDNEVIKYVNELKPSKRGELEITDLNKIYLKKGKLKAIELSRGYAWLDTGTASSLIESSQFIHTIESRQGLKVACIEEVSYRNKWINKKQMIQLSRDFNNDYGLYLKSILREPN